MIIFRYYKTIDYSQVKTILQEAGLFDEIWDSQENLSGMIAKDPKSIIIAVDKDEVVGSVYIVPFGTKSAHIYRLAVSKNYRNKGIGTKLIDFAQKTIKSKGIVEIALYVDAHDQKLQSFYQNKSFKTSKKSYISFWKEL
jgi:ribosomal protein S18 acetylase RimI-like enzyme